MDTRSLHSEEFFGDSRNFWWNDDYIELIAKRLKLSKYENILDIGCGLGH